MVFSLANLLFILSVILTNLWSLPMSAFVITSQFVTIPLWLLNVKSVWFLVSPSGDSQVQYLIFFYFWNSICAVIKLCASANSITRSPVSFLSPIPNAPMLLAFFCFSSKFCIEISCNDFICGVTISHCSFNIIVKIVPLFHSPH